MSNIDKKLKEKAYGILKRKGQRFSEKFKNSDLNELLDEIEISYKELEEEKKELIKKEKKLKYSNLEYEKIFMNAPIVFIVVDEKFIMKKLNYKADGFFQISKKDLIKNKSFINLIAKGGIKSFLELITNDDEKDKNIEIDLLVSKTKNKFLLNALEYPLNKNWKIITLSDIQKEKDLTIKTQLLNKENEENYKEILYSLIEMVEKRDPYTAGHSDRVAKYSKKIAQKLNLSKKECELVYEASMLHDMGKIVIPDAILLNPNKLNELEYKLIQEHASIGADLLENIKSFKAISKIIRYHHERENGSGYPEGLKSKEIPLLSKIIAVADSFDAMTTSRVYSNKKSKDEALIEISKYSNILYDENIVDASIEVLKDEIIDININQDPISHMDKARFSYFYKDQLTGLYNKSYLECFVKTGYLKHYKYLNIISIKCFSKYNLKHSWHKGDVFLKDFAEELLNILKKDELFRVKGDNFYILSKNKNSLNMDALNEKFKDNLISFVFNSYILKDYKIKSLEDILSIKEQK